MVIPSIRRGLSIPEATLRRRPIGWNWGKDYNILIKYQPTDTRYCISTFRIIQRGGFCKWHMQLEMKKDGAQKAGTALAYGS